MKREKRFPDQKEEGEAKPDLVCGHEDCQGSEKRTEVEKLSVLIVLQ